MLSRRRHDASRIVALSDTSFVFAPTPLVSGRRRPLLASLEPGPQA